MDLQYIATLREDLFNYAKNWQFPYFVFDPADKVNGLPGKDFNLEIVPPGVLNDLPEGAVGVRMDDNFWIVATLPYRFKDLTCADIVAIIYPQIENPVFGENVITLDETELNKENGI